MTKISISKKLLYIFGITCAIDAVLVFYIPKIMQYMQVSSLLETLSPQPLNLVQKPLAENDGKIVYLSGKINYAGIIQDPDFKFGAYQLLAMNRLSEQYRWIYSAKHDQYLKAWSLSTKDLPKEARIAAYKTPKRTGDKQRNSSFYAPEATLANYKVDPEIFAFFPHQLYNLMPLTDQSLQQQGYEKHDTFLYHPVSDKSSLDTPKVGDLKLSWTYLKTGTYSLIAYQQKQQLTLIPQKIARENRLYVAKGAASMRELLTPYTYDPMISKICSILAFILIALSGGFLFKASRDTALPTS